MKWMFGLAVVFGGLAVAAYRTANQTQENGSKVKTTPQSITVAILGIVKESTYANPWKNGVKPVEWRVRGRQPEMVWFVWADEKPKISDPASSERMSYVLGVLALGFMAAGAFALARGGDNPPPS